MYSEDVSVFHPSMDPPVTGTWVGTGTVTMTHQHRPEFDKIQSRTWATPFSVALGLIFPVNFYRA